MRQQLIRSLRRHQTTNRLFVGMASVMIAASYTILAMAENWPFLDHLAGPNFDGALLWAMLMFLFVIVMVFTVTFLVYMNGLLIRRRDRELAMLRLLGMPANRLGRQLFLEAVLLGAVAVVLGIAGGVVVSKAVAMGLVRLMARSLEAGLLWSGDAVVTLVVLYTAVFIGLGVMNQIFVARLPVARALRPTPTGTGPLQPSIWRWFGAVAGLVMTSYAYVGAFNFLEWGFALMDQYTVGAQLGFMLSVVGGGVLGLYLMFRDTLPMLGQLLMRTRWARRNAVVLLTLADLNRRLRGNGHSLFLTMMLATLTMTVIGSGAILYQYGRTEVEQAAPFAVIATKQSETALQQPLATGQLKPVVTLTSKLAAGQLSGTARQTGDRTVYNVISLTAYRRVRQHQPALPELTVATGHAVVSLMGQSIYRTTWLNPQTDWLLTLPRMPITLRVDHFIGAFPMSNAMYFDRLAIVSDADYAAMAGPTDRLTAYTITGRQAGQDLPVIRESVAFPPAVADGQKALVVREGVGQGNAFFRDALVEKAPLMARMDTAYGFSLFIAVAMGAVFMVATAGILLMKLLIGGVQEAPLRSALVQLGMPAKSLRRIIRGQTGWFFSLPLMFGATNAGLIIRFLSTALDDPGVGPTFVVVGVYAGVYLAFAVASARLIARRGWALKDA